MNSTRNSASDASYHSRHKTRTLRRAECIAANISTPGRVLDIGCNNGITSQFLLDSGKATHVTGVELYADTVDESLRNNPNFRLIEGNIVDIDLHERYDFVVYGAVHHSILMFHGLTAAIETLQKLASRCDGQLFFETGQIGEGGRWPWQREIRKTFRTDEEHFNYLLQSVEQFIKRFDVIGKFWIHGIRRSFLRLEIGKSDKTGDAVESGKLILWPENLHGPIVRTCGSRNQSRHLLSQTSDRDSPNYFWTSGTGSGKGYFFKQHCHHPVAAMREANIGNQITREWAISPVGITEAPIALVFPLLEDPISILAFTKAQNSVKQKLASQVLKIFADANRIDIITNSGLFLPTPAKSRLVDVCDLNPNNLVVSTVDGHHRIYVVDFEQQSAHYAYRNRLHLAKILWALEQHRIVAVTNFLIGTTQGVWFLFYFQFQGFADRVAAKQPSITSLLVAEIRSVCGRLLDAVLRVAGLDESR